MYLLWQKITLQLENFPAPDLNVFFRVMVAKIFYDSSRTKVDDGFLGLSDTTIMLFEEEYALPLLPPEVAAHLALYAETFLPILLILGLATRISAAGLLAMTLVIQVFVYPSSWTDHLIWAVMLSFLVLRGAGGISLDTIIGKSRAFKGRP